MRKLPIIALSFGLLLAAAQPRPAQARPLSIFDDGEEKKELRKARRELEALKRKIMRKKIPPIEFEFNSAVLKPYSKTTLEFVADLMFKYPNLKLMISGHTCDIGSDEYNLWLSQKRAESVKDYLVELGVFGEFIRAKGYGEEKPIASNDTEEGRMLNRRVEFQLLQRWWGSIY